MTPTTPETVYIGKPGEANSSALYWSEPGAPRRPGVVFVCEAFGLEGEMRRLAAEVASWGYAVLAPDLFAQGSWIGCLRRLMRDLKAGTGPSVRQLLDARDWLAARPEVDNSSLGIIGFCIGGGFALLLADEELFRSQRHFTVTPLISLIVPAQWSRAMAAVIVFSRPQPINLKGD